MNLLPATATNLKAAHRMRIMETLNCGYTENIGWIFIAKRAVRTDGFAEQCSVTGSIP